MTRYYDDKLKAWVTVCPAGAALGSNDLQNWGHRRALGKSGSDGWKERKQAEAWAKRARRRWRPGKRERAAIKNKSAK
jgi:hypothetical protein